MEIDNIKFKFDDLYREKCKLLNLDYNDWYSSDTISLNEIDIILDGIKKEDSESVQEASK